MKKLLYWAYDFARPVLRTNGVYAQMDRSVSGLPLRVVEIEDA